MQTKIENLLKETTHSILRDWNITGIWKPASTTMKNRFLSESTRILCINGDWQGIIGLSIPGGVATIIASALLQNRLSPQNGVAGLEMEENSIRSDLQSSSSTIIFQNTLNAQVGEHSHKTVEKNKSERSDVLEQISRKLVTRFSKEGISFLTNRSICSTDPRFPAPVPRRVLSFFSNYGNMHFEIYLKQQFETRGQKQQANSWWNSIFYGDHSTNSVKKLMQNTSVCSNDIPRKTNLDDTTLSIDL